MILFVGELRQLAPVIPNFSIRKFQLLQPMRAPDATWADFLFFIAKDQIHRIQDRRERFPHDVEIARSFFCFGLQPNNPFLLDRQWRYATNKPVNRVNRKLHQWRSKQAELFGVVSPFAELMKPLSNCHGTSESQQLDFVDNIDTPDLPENDV